MGKQKSIYLSPEAIKKVETISKNLDRSFSEIVERAIKEFKTPKK